MLEYGYSEKGSRVQGFASCFGDARLGKRSRARCGQSQGLLKTPAPLVHAYDVERCGSTGRPASAVQGASSPDTAALDIAMIR